ncbi:hypothetical protein ACFWCB_32635 [Streptomyces sp. NPDC060048]|uniref:hypothetical protein n=1 Tax=unclassified Streptomyces TaxID=2593676 RepID=UPI0036A063E9
MFSAALIAAGVVFVPGPAQADPGRADGGRSAAEGAAAARAGASGNPDLQVGLGYTTNSAHEITLGTDVVSADAPLTVTIAWGDGTETATEGGSRST